MQKKHNKILGLLPLIVLALVTLVIGMRLSTNPLSQRLPPHDSSMFIYFGKGIEKGLIPYVDMYDHKGPVLFFIQFIGTVFFKNGYLGIWILECVALFVTLYFTFKASRLFSNSIVSLFACLLPIGLFIDTMTWGNLSEQYALPFISFSLYVFLAYFSDKLKMKPAIAFFLVGVSGALTFFIRANMIAVWAVFLLLILTKLVAEKHWQELGRIVLFTFLGGMLTSVIVVIPFIITGSFKEMISQVFILNVKYSTSTLGEKALVSHQFYELMTRYGFSVFSCGFLVLGLTKLRDKDTHTRYIFIGMILVYILNWYTIIISGRFYAHYFLTHIPILSLITTILLGQLLPKSTPKLAQLLLIPLAFMIPASALIVQLRTIPVHNTHRPGRDAEEIEIGRYIKENSKEEDTIYVHNIDANIYLQSERFSNSRYFVLPSLDYSKFPETSNEFVESFSKNPPLFIVTFNSIKDQADWRFNQDILDIVNKDYKLVKQTSELDVYKHVQ